MERAIFCVCSDRAEPDSISAQSPRGEGGLAPCINLNAGRAPLSGGVRDRGSGRFNIALQNRDAPPIGFQDGENGRRHEEIRMCRQGLSSARSETFSNGVIAVIITILVLNLRVPEPDGLSGLRVVLPAIFSIC
jgi:hypothetical protein